MYDMHMYTVGKKNELILKEATLSHIHVFLCASDIINPPYNLENPHNTNM